jgi:hypothetical protein
MSPEVARPPSEEVTMSDDFDVITGPAAPLRPVPPASLPLAPQPAPAPAKDNGTAGKRR